MAERERPWRDVIAALEADIMIMEGIEHRHPEIELRPTITNVHLAIQGIMDLITESQDGEPTPESEELDAELEEWQETGMDTLRQSMNEIEAPSNEPSQNPTPESEPGRDAADVVERLEDRIKWCVPSIANHSEAMLESMHRDALSLIRDLQVEAASQERWADEYKGERDELQAERERLREALRYMMEVRQIACCKPDVCAGTQDYSFEDQCCAACKARIVLTGEQKK